MQGQTTITSQAFIHYRWRKQNIQEIWRTIKRRTLRIVGVEEEELQLNGLENIFNKIIEENFPTLKEDIPMKVHEAYRTPNRLDQKKNPLTI